jgi:PPOX class probable F420-dependent enzyme
MGVPIPASVRELFEGKNFAHVATVMKDGSPQVTVVWVDIEGDRIVVNTAEGRAKPRNVRRDPRVAISIIKQQDPYKAAFIRGRVVAITREGAEEHIDKMAKKYTGAEVYAGHSPERPRVLLYIEADHVREMGR